MIRFSIMDSTREEPAEIRCNNPRDAIEIICSLSSPDMKVCAPEVLRSPVLVTLTVGVQSANTLFTTRTDKLAEIAEAIAFLSRYGIVRLSECRILA